MRKMYNERHTQMDNMATDLDVLEVLKRRGAWDAELEGAFKYLDAKDKGLNILLEKITKYAKEHWLYMTNVSLSHDNTLNCNFLLMTSTTLYTFEIIHYEGLYEVKDGNGFLNGEMLDHEPIHVAQKVASKVKNLAVMSSIPVHLDIKGVAVFTNPNTEVEMHDEMDPIEIVTSQQLESFIKKIVQEEKQQNGRPTQKPSHLRWLARIDRHHPLWGVAISDEIEDRIQLGITCSHCDSFNVKIGEVLMACDCGGWEATEEAIVRTICEYGVLNQDKNLYPPDLHSFFNDQISMDDIEKHLAKHFTAI